MVIKKAGKSGPSLKLAFLIFLGFFPVFRFLTLGGSFSL